MKIEKPSLDWWNNLSSEQRLNHIEFAAKHDRWERGIYNQTWRGETIYKIQYDWVRKNLVG